MFRQAPLERSAARASTERHRTIGRRGDIRLRPGDDIALIGAMVSSREKRENWELEVIANGFIPVTRITMRTRLLVAADSASRSFGARLARFRRIPIVDEAELTELWGLPAPR